MVDVASHESSRGQSEASPIPEHSHAHAHASSGAPALSPQGPGLGTSDANFQMPFVPRPAQSSHEASMQTSQMYPAYMAASQPSSALRMGQMSAALPMQNPSPPLYFFAQQQGGRLHPSLAAPRSNFAPGSNMYQNPYSSPVVAGGSSSTAYIPYPGMMNPSASQFGSFQSYQHGNIFYPGSAAKQVATNGMSVSNQAPMPSHLTDHNYGPQMAPKPYGAAYASNLPAMQAYPYSVDMAGQQSVSRGPPRKPRQSGHALWVGNLPPGASVLDLKDHFSRNATDDIESVKLISKSNCAFVNYKTQAACAAAMQRFHDSRFYGIRLVCRLRRTSAPNSSSGSASVSSESTASRPDILGSSNISPSTSLSDSGSGLESTSRVAVRYFILKSLTLQDLEASTSTGIWATQAHNEAALNAAYHSAEDVYLIFSANKSGEYFGYARMSSAIPAPDLDHDELAEHIGTPESASASERAEVHVRTLSSSSDTVYAPAYPYQQQTKAEYVGPRSIPTAATEWAPKGRIIDDLVRGTIFWEADVTDVAVEEEQTEKDLLPDSSVRQQQSQTPVATEIADSSSSASGLPSEPSARAPVPALQTSPAVSVSAQYPIIARSPIDVNHTQSQSFAATSPGSHASESTASQAPTSAASVARRARTGLASEAYRPPPLQRDSSSSQSQANTSTSSDEASARGNPFRIDWMSMRRVPFYRTRGLRNALNNNREVKIARDGTEVEAGVGGRLLVLFGGGLSVAAARGGGVDGGNAIT